MNSSKFFHKFSFYLNVVFALVILWVVGLRKHRFPPALVPVYWLFLTEKKNNFILNFVKCSDCQNFKFCISKDFRQKCKMPHSIIE